MLKKQKGFSTIVIIAVVLVVIAGGVLAWQYLPAEPVDEGQIVEQEQPVSGETANWQTYRNDVFGFSFDYPSDWIIESDTLPKTNRETVSNESLILVNNFAPENPKLVMWSNALGFGIGPVDFFYNLSLNSIGNVFVSSVEKNQDSIVYPADSVVIIFSKLVQLGANKYAFKFSFNEGGQDFAPTFNQILSTFKFVD